MDEDLRQLAISANEELQRIAEKFPLISPGRKVLRAATWKLNLHYVWGTFHKEKIILLAIGRGHRRLSDIVTATGISRRETCELLNSLVERGHLIEGREPSAGTKGRPFRVFSLSEEFKSRNARLI